MIILTVFIFLNLSVAEGGVVTLFETSEPLIDSLVRRNSVDISIDHTDFFQGPASIRLEVTAKIVNGQAASPEIPDWRYEVVRNPVGSNEVRWVMFAWKKPRYDGIMVQFADDGTWRHRYLAGKNPAHYPAIGIALHAPTEWELIIRDLYEDFGTFTLTGIALTPFKGTGFYDSIYLAGTKGELLSILDGVPDGTTKTTVLIESPRKVDENEDFVVSVAVADVVDLAGFEMHVAFNPEVLRAKQVDEGDFLSSRGFTYWLRPDRDNQEGRITDIMCSRRQFGGTSGGGTLFTITFDADEMGESDVVVENLKLFDSQWNRIAANVVSISILVADFPPWDVDRSGRVDVGDFVIVGQYYNQYVGYDMDPNPDVTGDGRVDDNDFIALGRHYGEVYSSTAPAKLPYRVPARFIPDLVKIRDRMGRSLSPDRDTIQILDQLILDAKSVKIAPWGSMKRAN